MLSETDLAIAGPIFQGAFNVGDVVDAALFGNREVDVVVCHDDLLLKHLTLFTEQRCCGFSVAVLSLNKHFPCPFFLWESLQAGDPRG